VARRNNYNGNAAISPGSYKTLLFRQSTVPQENIQYTAGTGVAAHCKEMESNERCKWSKWVPQEGSNVTNGC